MGWRRYDFIWMVEALPVFTSSALTHKTPTLPEFILGNRNPAHVVSQLPSRRTIANRVNRDTALVRRSWQ